MKKAMELKTINLELPAHAKYLVITRQVGTMAANMMGFQKEYIEDLETAIGEATINVVLHAYKEDSLPYKFLKVQYLLYPDKLFVLIKDHGCGFDHHFVQQYVERKKADIPEQVGLGIFLIKSFMDEVEYDSNLNRGTQVRMTKYIRRKANGD
ncbi:MAG: ATP-binding protein [Bacteroidetes bacterium]|nr:ATP-binding protein [Bacteroidota bacterium]